MDFTLDHAYPLLTVQPWPELANLDHEAFRQAIGAPSFRDRMRQSLSHPDGGRIFNGDWSRVEVTIAATPTNQAMEGRTIADIAAERKADPVDVFLDIGLQEDLETTFTAKLLNVEEDRVGELLEDDGNMVSLSDGGAHLTFFCDAGFGMHFLGHWVRDLGRFDLPRAVRKLTSDVADIYGLQGRGRIEVGAHADLILFDPEKIAISKTQRVADLPGGASRLVRNAPGLQTVWVNGTRVYDQGEYVNQPRPPGHVITRFSESRPSVAMPAAQHA
jgi:N-acyl-D-aspartate/D-glutamate deacylase